MMYGQKSPSARQGSRYSSTRRFLAVLFVLSTCVLLMSILVLRSSEKPPPGSIWPAGSGKHGFNTIGILSLLVSIASLVGIASTTYLQWREDKRETKEAAMEQIRKQLEIEKLRLELERMRAPGEE